MELKIKEVHSIIKMLQSEDVSNHQVAFEILNKVDYEKNLGELFVIYTVSKIKDTIWKTNCQDLYNFLFGKEAIYFGLKLSNSYLTFDKLLIILKKNNSSKNSFILYQYFFEERVKKFLSDTGYPIKDFNITIKLNSYE